MSENEQQVEASPEEVFAILADGWTYADWVVGAARIRSVDPGWPQPGCSIRHSVGGWPLLIDDSTTVQECRQPEYLRLKVRAWPTGEGRVEFFVEPNGTGSLVRMCEARCPGRRSCCRAPSPSQHCAGATPRRCAGSGSLPSGRAEFRLVRVPRRSRCQVPRKQPRSAGRYRGHPPD